MKIESLALLREIRGLVTEVKSIGPSDEDVVKTVFRRILEGGDSYNVAEIEKWIVAEATGADQSVVDRIMNIAHYQKSKFEANNKFRMVSDDNECGCGCGH